MAGNEAGRGGEVRHTVLAVILLPLAWPAYSTTYVHTRLLCIVNYKRYKD